MKDKIELMVLALMGSDEEQAAKLFSEITESMSMKVVSEMVGWNGNMSPPEHRYSQNEMDKEGLKELNKAMSAIHQRDQLTDGEDADLCIRVQEEGGPYAAIDFTGTMSRHGDDYQFEVSDAYLVDASGNRVKDPNLAKMAEAIANDLYGWDYEQNMNAILGVVAQIRQYIQQRSA